VIGRVADVCIVKGSWLYIINRVGSVQCRVALLDLEARILEEFSAGFESPWNSSIAAVSEIIKDHVYG